LWYTTATGGTGSTTAPTPSTSTVGTVNYYVSQTTGTCEGPRALIAVNVGALPATPIVTTPVLYCQGATAIPLTATGTNLLWYVAATGGTGSTTAPTPLTTTVGSTTYYVSQSNNGCESPRASIVVTINALPPAPTVTTPVVYCQGATAVALTATGTNLLWYLAATGGAGSATAPTPSTATVGSTIYYVSQTNASSCEGLRASITVTVNVTPPAPTVTTPVVYCQGATATPLTATGTNLLWYTAATGGTGSTTAPTPSTITVGSQTYYVSQTTGSCEGPRASITVTINSTPPAPITAAISYCQGATATPLTATGTNLLWYAAATGGTGSTTAPTPTTTTVGTQTYYASQTTGICEGPRAALVVTVNVRPGAPLVVSPLAYCQNGTAPALTATGTNLLYYTAATGGTGTASLTPSTSSAGSTTYYVSQTTGTCEGPRAAIVVNVSQSLTANAGNAVTIGRGDQTQLNGTGTAGARYLWTSNIAPLALLGLPSSATTLTPIANPLQTTTYTLTVSDGNTPALCPSVSSSVVVTVVSTCINVKNAFTPNGDGINDKWVVYEQSFCFKPGGATVNVFNRYGSKVYESKNYTNSWDGTYKGKPVPDGTYYAVVEFILLNGNKQVVKTDVTVLR
jgi:gliding motility-associated-like protein